MQQALTVQQLNTFVKSLLDGDPRLLSIVVCGEITNFKRHISSGHIYFTLNDGQASIKCVMFKGNALRNKFELKDGISVLCRGRVSIYEKDGTYQMYVESCVPDGIGDQLIALKLLKEKLALEGLFDTESKRPIPKFPKRIAVVTSGSGAAVQDIINVISRRFPICELIICKAGVQGANAVSEMIAVLDRIYDIADKVDTIIIGRGGGSSEDLSAFNDEALARKIYNSPIPVISAVGHETDVSICDLVADLRAPTPSAAGELAVPDKEEIFKHIYSLCEVYKQNLRRKYETGLTLFNAVMSRKVISKPEQLFSDREIEVDRCVDSIVVRLENYLSKKELSLGATISKIDALSPMKVLSRGYCAASVGNTNIKNAEDVSVNDKISLTFVDGKVNCLVTDKE